MKCNSGSLLPEMCQLRVPKTARWSLSDTRHAGTFGTHNVDLLPTLLQLISEIIMFSQDGTITIFCLFYNTWPRLIGPDELGCKPSFKSTELKFQTIT
jgi:hypothetical protein